MKQFTLLATFIVLAFTSCQTVKTKPLIQGEQPITFAHTEGIFTYAGYKAPAVLLLHGFASNKNEVGGLYKKLSDALYKEGISSLRIDFRGWGDSSYPMYRSSVDNMILDAEEALHWLKTREEVGPIGIQGFSLGSGVAIHVAAKYSDDIKVMVLWSCINMFEEQAQELMEVNSSAVKKAMTKGKAEFDLGWRKVTLGKNFFKSLFKYNLQMDYTEFHGNVLIVDGAEDPLVKGLKTYKSLAPERTTIFSIPNAGHIFKVLSGNQTPAKILLQKTVDWYAANLK